MRRSSPRTRSEGHLAIEWGAQLVGLTSASEATNAVADRFAAVSTSRVRLNRLALIDQTGLPCVRHLP